MLQRSTRNPYQEFGEDCAEEIRRRKRERKQQNTNDWRDRLAAYPKHDPPVGIMVYVQRSTREKIRINLPIDPTRKYSKQDIDREIGKVISRLVELDYPPKYRRHPPHR